MEDDSQKKCELCGKNDAVIHVQQIMGSEIIDLHLCEECAKHRGITGETDSLDLSISELLTGLLHITSEVKSDIEKKICPRCGLTYKEFQKDGQLGCAECVRTFRKEVYALLENIAGTHQHAGKYPSKLTEFKRLLIDKEQIKQKLLDAIKNEDYEAAAVLRDKIHDLERTSERTNE
jgi:protein arginine kinase activator